MMWSSCVAIGTGRVIPPAWHCTQSGNLANHLARRSCRARPAILGVASGLPSDCAGAGTLHAMRGLSVVSFMGAQACAGQAVAPGQLVSEGDAPSLGGLRISARCRGTDARMARIYMIWVAGCQALRAHRTSGAVNPALLAMPFKLHSRHGRHESTGQAPARQASTATRSQVVSDVGAGQVHAYAGDSLPCPGWRSLGAQDDRRMHDQAQRLGFVPTNYLSRIAEKALTDV